MNYIYDQLVQDYSALTYEAFINLLVDIMEDQTSPEQLREAFRGLASDKVTNVSHSRPPYETQKTTRSLLSQSWICGLRSSPGSRLTIFAK